VNDPPDPGAGAKVRTLDRERWQRVSALLDGALEQPPEARASYLDAACGAEGALRLEVEELLAAETASAGFLAVPAAERAAPLIAIADEPNEPAADARGRVLGAYRLVSELGEGGMGTVYLAERADGQFEQQVALKLMKHGLPGEASQRRFLQERQILARLQHPAIARLVDGGVTPEGVPFFVMERVLGRPVTEHCRERQLGLPQVLRIFLDICDAAQYAHRNLVVHRDLKPSNILVDVAGHVKLLDFGIAKLLAEGHAEPAAESTRTLLRAFTPEYAAPELLLGEPVTTATDVYSLGVLLYELLTGERPHRAHARRRGAGAGGARAGPRPAQQPRRKPGAGAAPARRPRLDRAEGAAEGAGTAATPRPRRSLRTSGGTSRASPSRRVATRCANRTSKFLRRHRLAAAAALIVLLSLLAGLVGTAWQARRAPRARRRKPRR
jgi:serine/threonine-protein kinase